MRTPSISRRTVIGLTGALLAPVWRTRANAQSVRRAAVTNGRRFLEYQRFHRSPAYRESSGGVHGREGPRHRDDGRDDARNQLLGSHVRDRRRTAGTDIRLRIFGRGGEMPFAGHPVIGSTFALADDGVIAAGTTTFMFGLNLGPTLVELEWKQNALALPG